MVEGVSNDYPALETAGPNWDVFAGCIARIAAAVRADLGCEVWLASSAGLDRLNDVFEHPEKYFAIASHFLNKDGTVDNWTDASTDDVAGYGAIINFVDFQTNPPVYNWDTILHEMAHILRCEGFHQNDAEDDAAQAANAALLLQHCGEVLKRAH